MVKVDFNVYQMLFKYILDFLNKKSCYVFALKHTVEPFRQLADFKNP